MRVLVIGAGIAGLTAAQKLAGAGINVQVLEKENYVGGRIKTDFGYGLHWNAGAQFIGRMYRHTCDLLKETGLYHNLSAISTRVDVLRPKAGYPLCRHTPLGPCPSLKTLPLSHKLGILKLVLFLGFHRNRLDISNLPAGIDLDDVSFGDWAEKFLSTRLTHQYLDPVVAALFFQKAKDISRLIPLTLIGAPHKCGLADLKGGLCLLPETLAQNFPVIKNRQVLKITVTPVNSAEVLVLLPGGKTEKLQADKIVLAVPPNEATALLTEPQQVLGLQGLAFLSNSRFVSVFVTSLILSSPAGAGRYGFVFHPDENLLTSISFGRINAGGLKGGLQTATIISAGSTTNYASAPPTGPNLGLTVCLEQPAGPDLLMQAEKYLPSLAQKTVQRRDYYWKYGLPCFPPGRVREIVKFLNNLDRTCPVTYCGDYLGGPGLEGAVASGIAAADRIIRSRY